MMRSRRSGLGLAATFGSVALVGCGQVPTRVAYEGSDQVEMITIGEMPRMFRVHVPDRPTPGPAAPVILAFHGSSQTAEQLEQQTGLDAAADANGMIVVYLESSIGQWDVAGSFDVIGVDDLEFTRRVLARVAAEHVVDASRVVAVGLSNGAEFVQRLGCEFADHLVGIVAVAGSLVRPSAAACHPVRPISALYVLGTEDPFFPAAGDGTLLSFDSTLAFWGRHNQCGARRTSTALPDTAHDGTRVWRSAYSGCTGRAQVVLDSVVGGGHAWPGAVVPTNPATLGVTSRNLSTNDAIIRLLRGVAP